MSEIWKDISGYEGQAVQTISSREVAEMMDVRHDNLLQKIDSISKDLATKF